MFPSSEDYENVINRIIRPSTQVIIREYSTEDIPPEDLTYYSSNVDTELMNGAPNFEPLRDNTYYATFALGGYCVGDENLRCVPNSTIPNSDVMPISKYLRWDGNIYPLYRLDNITELNQDIYITVAPTYQFKAGIHLTGYDKNDAMITDKVSVVDRTTEATVLHFVLDVVCDHWVLFWGAFDNADARISVYPPSANENQIQKILFSNNNLTRITYQKSTDLLVQDEFNYSLEVTALDLDRLFDPANPQGIYNDFTELYRVLVTFGYEIEQGRYEYPYRKVMYLTERPTYDGNKVSCKFGLLPWVANLYNNNLIKPKLGNGGSFNSNLFDVLKATYVNPPNFGETLVTRIMREKTGYVRDDYSSNSYSSSNVNTDIYKLLTNATGMYISEGFYINSYNTKYGYTTEDFNEQLRRYFAGEISEVKHLTRNDIDESGFSLQILPQLKTLTIYKYTNEPETDVSSTITGIKLEKSDFEPDDSGNSNAYYTIENIDGQQISDCRVYNFTGANLEWYTATIVCDKKTGICNYAIRVRVKTSELTDNGVTFDADLYGVKQSKTNVDLAVSDVGEDMVVDNPYITTDKLVEIAQKTIKAVAMCREVYRLTVVQDIRLQLGDIITIDTPYENEVPCIVTGLKYNIPSIKGEITCRRLHYGLDRTKN